jgi:hypothetical protein
MKVIRAPMPPAGCFSGPRDDFTRTIGILPMFAWAVAGTAKVCPDGRLLAPPGSHGRR